MYLNNNRGFSLIEITVAMALVGGIALATLQLIQNQKNAENLLRGKAEISKTVNILKNVLNNAESCRYMLQGLSAPNMAPRVYLTGPLNQRVMRGTTPYDVEIIRPNSNYPGFRTGDFDIFQNGAFMSNANMRFVDLILRFRIKKKTFAFWNQDGVAGRDDQTIEERVGILAKLDATNKITDCGPVLSDQNASAREKFCLSLGALATWNGTTCKFTNQQCPYGQVPDRLASNATVVCVDIATKVDMTQFFDTGSSCAISASRGFSIVRDATSGKLRISCN